MPGRASLQSVIDHGTAERRSVRYALLDAAMLRLEQMTDVDNSAVQIGMPVEMVTRKMRNDGDERGLIVYGYKFRPAVRQPTVA